MPIRVKANIEGADKIAQRLRILPQEVSTQHLEQSVMAGAQIIRTDMERRAPRGTGKRQWKGKALGHLASNIQATVTKQQKGRLEVSIGPGKQNYYAMWLEFGHRLVRVVNRIKIKGRTRRITRELGSVPPHPFVRPAFDESRAEAEREVARQLRRRLKLQ